MSVLILHASASAEEAASIAAALAARGVGAAARSVARGLSLFERRALGRAVATAKKVLVLWSRAAPALLRELALRAQRAGKLLLARLDAERPALRTIALDLSRPDKSRALDALAHTFTGSRPMTETSIPRSMRLEGAGVMLVFAIVVATAVYFTNAAFAAQVDGAAHNAMALIDKIKS